MKKWFFLATALVLVFCSFVFYRNNSLSNVNITRDAVFFVHNEPSSLTPTSIHIKGTLHTPLFRQNKFVGKIIIDEFDFTRSDTTFNIYVTLKKNGVFMGTLAYQSPTYPFPFTEQSLIWFDKKLENISILLTTSWGINKSNKNAFIVTGTDYQDAIDIQKKMRDKFGTDFVPKK